MANAKPLPVIIIGAGPAGLATSLTLSHRGVAHLLADAAPNPTRKVGNALPPRAMPMLQQLGLINMLGQAPHLPYYGNQVCWGTPALEEAHFIKDRHGHGYLLDRLVFEQQLRQRVQATQAQTAWGFRLKTVKPQASHITVELTNGNSTQQLAARYIVDATGRKATVCRHLGIKKAVPDAHFAVVAEVPMPTPLAKTIYIEATAHGWWYLAPTLNQTAHAMFFTSKGLMPAHETALKEFFENQWASTLHLKTLLPLTLHNTPLQRMAAGTSALKQPYGAQWVAVGDAAYSYDPIASYGITAALSAGFFAGNALADALASTSIEPLATYHFAMDKGFKAYLKEWPYHYQSQKRFAHTPFWTQRVQQLA